MSLSLVLAGVAVLVLLALLFWKLELGLAETQAARRRKALERTVELQRVKQLEERQRTMLYDDMTVDEAQQVVWAWEEMSEEERRAMPLERRVQVRRIMADLEKHRRQWPER